MKKNVLDGIGGLLMVFACVLLLAETNFETVKELLTFFFIKLLGFLVGYVGYKMIDFD